MPGRSLYEMVGVGAGASAQEIRAAYRRAVRDAHPDLGGSDAAFRRVSAAYEVLRDPARRACYDRWLATQGTGRAMRQPAEPAAAGAEGAAQARQAGASTRTSAGASGATAQSARSWPGSPGMGGSGPRGEKADTSRLQRNYLVTMTTCLLLFVLSGAVVRAYSVPAAVAMAVVAMVLLPFAALMANRRAR
ncbi:MAG: J domain-containing protein [Frankiaceae bacterium]